MPNKSSKHELRCFCARKPLLAVYGLDNGELYIHVKIWKQSKIYGEILVKGGKVQIRCRECLRLHTITIRQPGTPVLEEASEVIGAAS